MRTDKHEINLQEIGLTPQESEAYQTALGLGTFPASILGSRLKIPRSTARYTCESLVRKGLMTATVKGNTRWFTAENPTKLHALLYEEELALARKKDRTSALVKTLEQKYDPRAKLPKVAFYEGLDGIERMTDEMLSSPSVLRSFWAGDYFLSKEPDLVKRFREKSRKKYRKVQILRSPKYRELHSDDGRSVNRYFQFIDELKTDIQIVEDKLSIIAIGGNSPIGILIQHQEIVDGLRSIFEELWERAGQDPK